MTSWRRRLAAVALGGVVLAAAASAIGITLASRHLIAPGPLAVAHAIVVPTGSPAHIAESLHATALIERPLEFRLAAWWTAREGALHAGEFAFPANASLRQVLTILRTGRPVQHRLTVPEGLTAAQIAGLLDRAEALAGETPLPGEGMVLPQTYAFERGTSRAVLLERMTAAMGKTLAETWASRDPALKITTPEQLLTLASLVERETSRPEERPHVAAVYLNRLRTGMKLQADPTVVYAASGGLGVLDHPLTRAELDQPSPYNTYRNTALPPGPIASPGLAALQAAAHPIASEDLYFVADGNGGHNFARTLDEHNKNVAHWRAQAAVAK